MSVEREDQENGYGSDKAPEDPPPEENKLFVGGISWHMLDRELKDVFRKFGSCEARVMVDRLTGRSRGFGFVMFHKVEDMEKAVAEMHNSEVDGRKVSVTKAIPQSQTAPGTPAAALSSGRGRDRVAPRYDRGGPRAAYDRGYDRRVAGYDRGYERGYPPERGYDRGYPPEYERGYDRGYDRGYAPPPGYGYERDAYAYESREPYGRYEYESYGRDPAYEYERYPPSSYDSRYPPAERTYARSSAATLDRSASGSRPAPPAYDRGAPASSYDRYGSRGGGPDREYRGYPASSSRPAPYERSAGAREERPSGRV